MYRCFHASGVPPICLFHCCHFRSNININDVLGNYSLTLIDTLDTLLVICLTQSFCYTPNVTVSLSLVKRARLNYQPNCSLTGHFQIVYNGANLYIVPEQGSIVPVVGWLFYSCYIIIYKAMLFAVCCVILTRLFCDPVQSGALSWTRGFLATTIVSSL